MNRTFTADLKTGARTDLLGKWSFVTGIFLMEFMWNIILQQLITMAFPSAGISLAGGISVPYLICRLIASLLSTILSAGSTYLYLNISRGKPFQFSDLFYGFLHQPEHIVGYFALMAGLMAVFTVVPVIFLVMALGTGSIAWAAGAIAAGVLCAAGYYRISLNYAMFPFLYADAPWKTSRELLRESSVLMAGNRLRYFYLRLSFAGVLLLSTLSFGIGLIWVGPYMNATCARFYRSLAESVQTDSADPGSIPQ